MIYVGIDPGLKGGLAMLSGDFSTGNGHQVHPMPTIKTTKRKKTAETINLPFLVEILRAYSAKNITVFLEKVGAMPKQGVSSTFKFGTGYGQIQGVLAALGVGFELVTPQRWMKTVLDGYGKGSGTKASVQYVMQKYPQINLLPTERSRKPSDGMADAVCIAEYGRLRENKEPKE